MSLVLAGLVISMKFDSLLEARLADVNAAIEPLNKNPEVCNIMTLLERAGI